MHLVLLGNKKLHPFALEISIKASHRYHGNHQEKSMSFDEAPCEAFNLMHVLELQYTQCY